jgi:hypothetical protein
VSNQNPEVSIQRDGDVLWRGQYVGTVHSYEPGFNCGTFWAYILGNNKQGGFPRRRDAANALLLEFQAKSDAAPSPTNVERDEQ